MNPIVSRAHDALWRAVTEEVALSHDAAVLWSLMLDAPFRGDRNGTQLRVIGKTGWHHSTAVSRLVRSGLPSVFTCSNWIGLAYAAALFDDGDDRVMSVAVRLGHSDSRAFIRFVRREVGMTGAQFRDTVPFPMAREMMLGAVVRPYADRWRRFRYDATRWPRLTQDRALVAA